MITRRTFLAAMATASLIPLAGCSSGQQPVPGQQSSGEAKEVEAKNGPRAAGDYRVRLVGGRRRMGSTTASR